MKLRNWQIEGFGIFSGASLPDPGLGDGINLFIGPNEAGKTTLLDFIRYTLFGYPSARNRRREPLRGGNHGGTLIYETDGLTYQLSRHGANRRLLQLRDASGAELTDAELQRHVGHIGADVFHNILGFSLAELQELKNLTEGDVRDLIFAASIGRSAALIRELEETLSKRADSLFRAGARPTTQNAPRIVKLQGQLDAVERRLEAAADASRGISGKITDLNELQASLNSIGRDIEDAKHETTRLEKLITGWPLLVKRRQAEEERKRLGDVSCFPTDGAAIWATKKGEFDKTRQIAQSCYEELRGIKEKLATLPREFPLLTLANTIDYLSAKRQSYEITLQRARDATLRASNSEKSWQSIQTELGQDWLPDSVRSFDISLLSEDEVRRLRQDVVVAQSRIESIQTLALSLAREIRGLSNECYAMNQQVEKTLKAGLAVEVDELKQQQIALGELRDATATRESLLRTVERAQTRVEQEHLYAAKQEPTDQPIPNWLSTVLIVVAVLLIFSASGLFYIGQTVGGALSVAFALILFGLAAVIRRTRTTRADKTAIASKGSEAQTNLASAQRSLNEHDSYWRTKASENNLSWPLRESEVAARDASFVSELARLANVNGLRDEVQSLRAKKRSKHSEFRKLRQQLEEVKETHSQALRSWKQFLTARRLPSNIGVDTAVTVFAKIKEGRGYLQGCTEENALAEKYEAECNSYINELRECLRKASVQINDDSTSERVLTEFQEIRQQTEEQRLQWETRRQLLINFRLSKTKLREAIRVARAAKRVTARFLMQLGVDDEVDLANLSERAKRYAELTQVIRSNEEALAVVFGHSIPQELDDAWTNANRPDWESSRLAYEANEQTLARTRDEVLRAQTTLQNEITSQIGSDEVAELQLERQEFREEIRQAVEEWTELATALELLQRTRKKFEDKNQSPALDEASRLFRIITSGRYDRVYIPLDSSELTLTIAPKTGPILLCDALSRGTLELLLLCIRLGYIQQFQREAGVGLPLLMDDVTVNFDRQRMTSTFEALAESARRGQQILFFTCHEELLEFLRPEDRCFKIKDFRFEREVLGPLLTRSVSR